MSEYTEGKLEINDTNAHGDYYIGTGKEHYIAIVTADFKDIDSAKANATELVRRWNAHDDLVKALKNIIEFIDYSVVSSGHDKIAKLKQQGRAALAQAVEGN